MKGAREGAAYISDNATNEQREILESFIKGYIDNKGWQKSLGYKFVKIDLSEENGTYHITMPFGEVEMSLAIGGDRKNPMRLGNAPMLFLSNVMFCNTHFWKYHDYGKKSEYHNTSGATADFTLSG